MQSLESFSQSYAEARDKFLTAARLAGAALESHPLDIDGNLTSDVAVLGPHDAPKAFLAVSGVHGIEGFCGSAIQHLWLSKRPQLPKDMKVVLVHAINPWAFAKRTRTDPDNIDINRNFFHDQPGAPDQNQIYDRLVPLIHGDTTRADGALKLFGDYQAYLAEHGAEIENEIWKGQWHRPDGLMYGGNEPCWSNRTFRKILRNHLAGAKWVGFIDWHTGIGKFGETVPLLFDPVESESYKVAAAWWSLKDSSDKAFKAGKRPNYRGLLCQAIGRELSGAKVAGAVIEFGTGDDLSLFRGDLLDRWLRFEGRDRPDHEALRQAYSDLFYPRDITWRYGVADAGLRFTQQAIDGVAAW